MVLWFHRLKRLFSKSDSDFQEDSAADPVQMADELLRDMDRELANMRASLNKQFASEKRLMRRLELAEVESKQREEDAIRFLEDQDEHSARLALLKKEEKDLEIQEISFLYETAHRHQQELLRHIDDQTADFQRLQTKKSELQLKRNLQPSSTVNEMVRTKKRDHETATADSVSFLQSGHSLTEEQKNPNEENALSPSASVDAKLEHLKKSLKKRN